MTNEKMRADFVLWHSQRAERMAAEIEVAKLELIADGFQDSPGTHQEALFQVLRKADGTGWDSWQAATLAERDRAIAACQFRAAASKKARNTQCQVGCNNCADAIGFQDKEPATQPQGKP